jgi:hypothetical protein
VRVRLAISRVAVAHRAALAQDGPHFGNRLGVLGSHAANAGVAIVVIALAAHDHAPVRQLVHRPDGQPDTPIEELALLIGQVLPHARRVIEDAAVQLNVLAAREDLQRVELQVLHRAHGSLGALDAEPSPPGPQALLAEDEAMGCLAGDG